MGILIGMTPTYGIQVILVIMSNTWLKINRIAGIVSVHITNPITALPIYWLDYKIGAHILGQKAITRETFQAKLEVVASSSFLDALGGIVHLGTEILLPMVLGSLVLGSVMGAVSYPVFLILVKVYKEKRALRRARRKLERRSARLSREEARSEAPRGREEAPLRDAGRAQKESNGNGSDHGPGTGGDQAPTEQRRFE